MNAVGIIAEYNPFHNGHLYHLEKIKEMFPNYTYVLVLSGHFMQRGETSIINKWDKTKLALLYGVDLVIELPYPFATQSADFFAKGSIQILKALGVNSLVFGSETNDIEQLYKIADTQLNDVEYKKLVKKHLNEGTSYKSALTKAVEILTKVDINAPNDILGVSYIKEIIKQEADITPFTIKRTNDYHGLDTGDKIASATSIRLSLKKNETINNFVPTETYNSLQNKLFFIEDYYPYLKYQILNNMNNLNKFQTVEEGIENRIKKYIVESDSLEELIEKVKTKRYTYNKLRRMFTHILCNFTKEEADFFKDVRYLRILGFSKVGRKYLNSIKKKINLTIVSNFSNCDDLMLDLEFRTTCVYASTLPEDQKVDLIEAEYKNSPIKI
ncbi:MAG: nucleotidyltransferase [Bacilli bacterium]|nr:nucleotidyltransferase [Bacilli bacterium]MDD4411565.1 nucleotidyltransferase [Bacilli bacterium]